ncbi:WD domain, G-beta repeat protein [Oesophagostomum dentatum]|uniref:WD domain, G-beta repeat protein n=1 Tax=Oesophagostomum dentatum TaxID=61180 RepID=A0A0B1TNA7_OESDE|nr:WD domain, G-beta repeat protein [Oesophagostomum dentatum]
MKVKMISRNPDDYQRETNKDIYKIVRNWNAPQDPFRAQTEYTRALNATKLERVFAKPFVASLDGHMEGVHILAKHPNRPSIILSGARDGQVKVWALARRHCLATFQTHNGPVNGYSSSGISIDIAAGNSFVTVGQDCTINRWKLPHTSNTVGGVICEQTDSINLDGVAHAVSHIANSSEFVTCGDGVTVWGAQGWVTMTLRPNRIAWNPIEAYTFAVASDDYNLYTFDMRYLDNPKYLHSGHTAAVVDLDYSPTGQEIVSGSFDRSVRIYRANESRSRDVYHTKRMSNVLSVLWSMDNKFVLSGSNEMNVRVWKAKAAEKLGPLAPREKAAFAYSEKLREQFKEHPEIRRIARHRNVPKSILHASREHAAIRASQSRKEFNRRKAEGIKDEDVEYVPPVKKSMVKRSTEPL